MKIAIHDFKGSFSERWIEYCRNNCISYKIVNCYCNDIIHQLSDCDALMWHFSQNSPRDFLFAKQLIYSIEASGKRVFPDFHTAWHFDDKVGQKYLLEAVGAPLVPTYIFYDKKKALNWAEGYEFPVVFKLRGGSGSQNVRLVPDKRYAKRLINKAFGIGFSLYDPVESLKERWRLYRIGKTPLKDILEGLARFFVAPPFARAKCRERGYVYFQKYIRNNNYDIRVVAINNRAFAIKRLAREDDFRASGSGNILYEKTLFDLKSVSLSLSLAIKLRSKCVAFDYVYIDQEPILLEISYGFSPEGYDPCPGYWDKDLVWHEEKFNPYGWMIESLIQDLNSEHLKG